MTIEALTSDLLSPVDHAFLTRKGGVSEGLYEGLNCGQGSEDDPDRVDENRRRAARAVSAAANALFTVHQHHSPDVVTVDDPNPWERPPMADAMVTTIPGVALGVLTADCAPVLFADAEAEVIGAAHAGWKGALDGVLEATLSAMEALGARRDAICVAIGPTISQRNYEVGPEFVERFLDEDLSFSRFFAGGTEDRAMFDLPGLILHRLREAGVKEAAWTGHCTYGDAERFFSYRRTTHAGEADYGRLISIIRL